MKNLFIVLLALGLAVSVYAVTTTNRGEVVTVTTLEEVAAATADTNLVTLVSEPANVLLSTDTDLTAADATAYVGTPGQLLVSISATGATKIVYMSNGWGTNDWVLLK